MDSAVPQISILPCSTQGVRRIKRVLIANRGEIGCRIIATCRKLGLTSIAIYVEEDARSRHVTEADETVCLGSINQIGGNPFLNARYLVDTAVSVSADAIHPGYGYLSENNQFADAVRAAGIVFIGPSSEAIATLGDKRQSKEYLRKHAPDIPLVPGFAGSSQKVDDLAAAAEEIGYPVMLKASAGGGGKGMRIVRERAQLRAELERAQSEAQRSFGSSDCILEKYIESAKHIEVQIIGDRHGNVLSLWERECSVQRRHQKIIEETPSPFLSQAQRLEMCAAAVKLGEMILYEGAGTVEFVVDAKDGTFYFLEVNTRLQVEHPITEEVTGLDLVALQLFVAAGGRLLDLPQLGKVPQQGHAIECRLCAEDPTKNFMPENGIIQLWREAKMATTSGDVRYETAVESGCSISIYFDSMIAKIVVWAPTRDLAITKMAKVMANTACVGLKSNQLFLQSCLLHRAFREPTYTTSFIADNMEELLRNPYLNRSQEVSEMLAAVPAILLRQENAECSTRPFRNARKAFRNQAFGSIDPTATIVHIINAQSSPAPLLCAWRTSSRGMPADSDLLSIRPLIDIGHVKSVQAITKKYASIGQQLAQEQPTDAKQYHVELRRFRNISEEHVNAALLEIAINGSIIHAWVVHGPNPRFDLNPRSAHQSIMCHFPALGTWVEYQSFSLLSYFEQMRDSSVGDDAVAAAKTIYAPMPCKVISILRKDGEEVKGGETVLVIESMKMETSITSSVGGVFRTKVKKGDAVDDGKVLCWFE